MDETSQEYAEIAPFSNPEFADKISSLVAEPGFEHAVRYIFPDIDFEEFVKKLRGITNKRDFQYRVMLPFLEDLARRTTAGLSFTGIDTLAHDRSYTFITNHRDIVLDAAFLNVGLMRDGRDTSEVAIGDNLLIYEWITDLVKLNGSFIVKRSSRPAHALRDARQLSGYIHYAINQKHVSIWIAQRQGRAKDSNDVTQESLVKMLALAGPGGLRPNLADINLLPVSISYEFDPNDFLKAREFLMRRRDPDFKKSQRDDLFSMETGMLQYKGRVHVSVGHCLDQQILALPESLDKQEAVRAVCAAIDREIHAGYRIYPINYVAYDRAFHTHRFSDRYTPEQAREVEQYLNRQLDKVRAEAVTPEERGFMLGKMYEMYANPLKNKLIATDKL